MSAGKPIILFDGVCNLCGGVITLLLKIDKQKRFTYIPIQSTLGKTVIDAYRLQATFPDSILYIRKGKVFQKSKAVFSIIEDLGGWWKILLAFRVFPSSFNDFLYDFIARNRYRIFGRKEQCLIIEQK